MAQAHGFHRKETKNPRSHEELAAGSEGSNVPGVQESNPHIEPCEKFLEALAPNDPQEHDLEVLRVTDDWPEIIPITSDEVEAIEAFFRDVLDDLLK